MSIKGVVASGHEQTTRAAVEVLQDGGNAYDAVVAAHFAACVCEPVLASLGGGGFLLARPAAGLPLVYDFFVQTPLVPRAQSEMEFFPIQADFGEVQQRFYVGTGTIATPGVVRGLYAVQKELCTLPMSRLVEPAIELARSGVRVNAFQAYILDIVKPIYSYRKESRALFGAGASGDTLLREGGLFRSAGFADCLDAIAREGEDLFYRGEIASQICRLCAQAGGHLRPDDLENYAVVKRPALEQVYRGVQLYLNPAPSSGGILIAIALRILDSNANKTASAPAAEFLPQLIRAMDLTDRVRTHCGAAENRMQLSELLAAPDPATVLDGVFAFGPECSRGTTQISVIDADGNLASLTTSNGEGCGYLVPGTGIMMNNMLGEEDLNPGGFHRWTTNTRMTSMMAPAFVKFPDGREVALGSGGSNRLRTAILQVLLNLVDSGMSLEQAVHAPRVHFEDGLLNVEQGFDEEVLGLLARDHPSLKVWGARNLFFGGVHSVGIDGTRATAASDPRRGGCSAVVE